MASQVLGYGGQVHRAPLQSHQDFATSISGGGSTLAPAGRVTVSRVPPEEEAGWEEEAAELPGGGPRPMMR